jgi:iron uptake system component EfeO
MSAALTTSTDGPGGPSRAPRRAPRRLVAVAATGVALAGLAVACSSTSTGTTTTPGGTAGPSGSTVSLSFDEQGCTPPTLSATAGDVTVTITNTGGTTGEVEVVNSDQRIKGEAENVAPGLSKTFTAAGLTPGTYSIVCGSDKASKGTLTIVGADGSTGSTPSGSSPAGSAGTVPPATGAPEVAAALDQYKDFVHDQAVDLQGKTKTFVAAVKAGDLAQAKALFGPTRVPYETIEPVAESFKDIDDAVDSRVDDHNGPDDPAFTGFHRLEYGLYEKNSLDGLAPIADKLQTDIDSLVTKTETLDFSATDMVKGAQELMEEVASKKITGEEDRYSHTDLWDFRANLDGSMKIFELVKAQVAAADPALADSLQKQFDALDQKLSTYENPDKTYKTYDALSEADKTAMSAQVAQLSEDLSKLPGVLGLAASSAPADTTGTTAG